MTIVEEKRAFNLLTLEAKNTRSSSVACSADLELKLGCSLTEKQFIHKMLPNIQSKKNMSFGQFVNRFISNKICNLEFVSLK